MEDTKFEPRNDEIFFEWKDINNNIHRSSNKELILAKLLIDEVVFCNDSSLKDYDNSNICEETIAIFVGCNDIWGWACADAETISTKELPELYKFYMADKKWGSLKWACKKRNLQPQAPIIKDMKKEDVWCDIMESLPENK